MARGAAVGRPRTKIEYRVFERLRIERSLEFKINFLRAMTHATGEVRGIGIVVHAGRTTAIAEGRIVDEGGKLYAFATTTCQIQRRATS